ncbi:MAG: phenylacetate--CoA ligase family protein [Calditrichae bacterium]|nr:phenylacetate--CoA ligase family protein [Calditrichia bacterium]
MNKNIAKYLVYYPIQFLRKQKVWKYLSVVNDSEKRNLQQILNERNKKLSAIVHYAYNNIRYYKELFDENKIMLSEEITENEFRKIPILTKHKIIKNEQSLTDQKYKGKIFHRKTGGSTGLTLHFSKEPEVLALNDAIMFRCYNWFGIEIGDKQARFWGVPVTKELRKQENRKDLILNRIRISAFDISEEATIKQYNRIKKFKPAYFYGYTTAIYGFCLNVQKLGLDLDELNLKAVICTAEKMYPHHRKLFNEVFKCPVVDEYGSTENGIISFQCKEGNLHMMADHMYIEFLDDNDQPVKPGESGRIVITDLYSKVMPFIRYDIGDKGSFSNEKCHCGNELPLMNIMEGRTEDFIKTKQGKMVHAAYLCYTLKDDTVQEFKMYQKSMDDYTIQLVKSPAFKENSEEALKAKVEYELGKDINIKFEYLDKIPREKSGKLRYFVSELKKQ